MSTGGVGHTHRFDPVSGWCEFCNLREDGKLIGRGGEVFRAGREYAPQELDEIRKRAMA
jgi:hypothetical protein